MFIDTRRLQESATVQTSVCIIGGGVAGITLARELERQGIDACLLESGGYAPDRGTRDLYRGENVGVRYNFADGYRFRYLGGSSNGWGGWCAPWDTWDFETRNWVPNSGWPFGPEEIQKYAERTHEVLELGPQNFEPDYWVRQINRPEVRRMPLVTGRMRDCISQFSPPTRFGSVYREELKNARNVHTYLYANVVNIEADTVGESIRRVEVRTLTGRTVFFEAKLFVLATGGIENARLLLASNKDYPAGLANGNDLVGRYFMDNPRLLRHRVRLNDDWASDHLYDMKYHYKKNSLVRALGMDVAAQFAVSQEVQEQEGLLNARMWVSSQFLGEETDTSRAVHRRKQSLLARGQTQWNFGADVATILTHPVETLGYGLTRFIRPRALINHVKLQMVIEQSPNPDSRVTLSSQRDALGMNRVRVDWRLGELEARTFNRGFKLLDEEFRASNVGEVSFEPDIDKDDWPENIEGTWHHMGTTRMHDSPHQGVVDSDSKVHGLQNMFIVGSSVFPTAGPNYPTIMLVALTLRLADRIGVTLKGPVSVT
jgi:choline dehydrogenase-like flavoprotein